VAFGTENVQAAGGDDFIVFFVGFQLVAVIDFRPLVGGNYKFFAGVVPDRGGSIFLRAFDLALCGAEGLGKAFL